MFALKLTQIGNSVGVVLPKEALAMLHVDKGDTVYAVESPEGVSPDTLRSGGSKRRWKPRARFMRE